MGWIDTTQALESVVGRAPAGIELKVIDHLDPHALHWIAQSPLMFATFGDGHAIAVTIGGGPRGFAVATRGSLALPLDLLDEPDLVREGLGFGSLFLVPGIGETLRVNGRVDAIADGIVSIAVGECYLHCAKALIRSEFWKAQPQASVPDDASGFIGGSRFTALATIDPAGHADLSPKGDPAGGMARLIDGTLQIPDRPGNRKTDSFRNLLVQPELAAAFLIPGAGRVAIVRGAARISTDPDVCAGFAVQGKTPLVVTEIVSRDVVVRDSPALRRASLWPCPAAPDDINPATIFVAHMKLNRDKGIGARIASAMTSVPGLVEKGLAHDYKKNLY